MSVGATQPNNAERPWPFDLSRYDRRKSLNKKERHALASATSGAKLCIGPYSEILDRLIVPLEDALAYIAGDGADRFQGAVWVLLREMHIRQLPFLVWSHEVWREVLDADHRKFSARTGYSNIRCVLLALAYLFDGLDDVHSYGKIWHRKLARHVFGQAHVELLVARVQAEIARIGYAPAINEKRIPNLLCKLLLANHSPRLEDLTSGLLEEVQNNWGSLSNKEDVLMLSRALYNFGIIDRPLRQRRSRRPADYAMTGVPALWAEWITRWRDTASLEPITRSGYFGCLCKVGRWMAVFHPELTDPALWQHEHAVEFIAALKQAKIGDWSVRNQSFNNNLGKPLSPATQAHHLSAVRIFFRDCQEWGWIPRRFNPQRAFQIPLSIKSKVGANPRVIADDVWAKLLWAGLNFTDDDVPKSPCRGRATYMTSRYPVEMIRAMALTWLFCGLRANEIMRLRVGCIRWQREDVPVEGSADRLEKDSVCWLDVPVTKTSRAFTKPVDVTVGKAIEEWERVRPSQQPALDPIPVR